MASAFTHAIAAASLGTVMVGRRPPPEGTRPVALWALGAAAAVLPDVDVIAFKLGIPYEHPLGHRGLTHSLAFAAALALAAAFAWTRARGGRDGGRLRIFAYLGVATASHGVLDAMTSGGLGVGFFIPLSAERFFLPWRPIVVSPISVGGFFSARGLAVIVSEIGVVWAPAAILTVVGLLRSRRTVRQ